jgi:hypothetical protein
MLTPRRKLLIFAPNRTQPMRMSKSENCGQNLKSCSTALAISR